MKRTNCGAWCHLACANWTPETALDPESGLICGVRCVSKVYPTDMGNTLARCSLAQQGGICLVSGVPLFLCHSCHIFLP
jgi:hypothetical protein